MTKILFLALALAISCQSCDFANAQRIRGNGNMKQEDRTVQSFSGISSHGSYDVYATQGAGYSLRIEAEENILPYIETSVSNGVLHITTREGYSISTRKDIKVYVTAPVYSKLETSGSGNIISHTKLTNTSPIEIRSSGSGDVKVDVNAPEIAASLSGSGSFNLRGETRDFSGDITGSGDIKASDLKAENVQVDITGSGNAEVFASMKLNVGVRGSGDVRYRGGAAVSQDITGSGSVKKVD